jgi:hypothetical protein
MRTVEVCACVLALGAIAASATAFPQNRDARAAAKPATPAVAASHSQTDSEIAEESQSKLPIRRVILYKTGVGYFEHLGEVRGNQTVGIDFTQPCSSGCSPGWDGRTIRYVVFQMGTSLI